MLSDKIYQIIEITLPVFGIVGLGKWLNFKGKLNNEILTFINWLCFTFCLPSLIFRAIAHQRLTQLFDLSTITCTVLPVFICTLIFLPLSYLNAFRQGEKGPIAFSPFWGNVAYIGIPLATSAYGDAGLRVAALINACGMPLYVVLGSTLLNLHRHKKDCIAPSTSLLSLCFNPVVNSVLAGWCIAFLAYYLPHPWIGSMTPTLNIIDLNLKLLGQMGLPLALLAVGASLKFDFKNIRLGVLLLANFGKLVLLPAVTLLCFQLLFPNANPVTRGACVLVSAGPTAIAAYVISSRMNASAELVSAFVVSSTLLSALTIPIWLLILLS